LKLIEKTDLSDTVYLLPLGDLHLGSKNCELNKFKGYINWVEERPNAYIFLMGDMFDTALIDSVTNPFEQTLSLGDAQQELKTILEPVKDKILGAITGNHENRLVKRANFDPLKSMCRFMGIEFCGYSAVIRFRVGKYKRKDGRVSPKIEYVFYLHHTTGGGSTAGGKLNRVSKLQNIFEGADCYIGAHNHFKSEGMPLKYYLSKSGNGKVTLKTKRIHLVDSGSFIKWDNDYPEMMMLPPADLGAPRIRMDGTRKDLHVSF